MKGSDARRCKRHGNAGPARQGPRILLDMCAVSIGLSVLGFRAWDLGLRVWNIRVYNIIQ